MRQAILLASTLLIGIGSAAAQDICGSIRIAETRGIVFPTLAMAANASGDVFSDLPFDVITYETTTVKHGDTTAKLATRNAIVPDSFNLDLIRKLNPAIADLNQLKPGDTISLPRALSDGWG